MHALLLAIDMLALFVYSFVAHFSITSSDTLFVVLLFWPMTSTLVELADVASSASASWGIIVR